MNIKYLKNHGKQTWVNGRTITPSQYVGFVYEIFDKVNNKKYIGLTRYWQDYKLQPLKGKINRRHFKKETKWREYNGSGNFQELIKNNPDRFVKTIIKDCKTITELKLTEAYIQLQYYMKGQWDLLYNEEINVRLRIRKSGR